MAFPWGTSITDAVARILSYYNGGAFHATDNPGGLANDGHRQNFVPALQDTATAAGGAADAANYAATHATAAAASAADAALAAAKLSGTSASSVAIGTGSKAFTTQSGKSFDVGRFLLLASAADPTKWVFGQVTAYSGTSLTVNVTQTGGTGTVSDWVIYVAGVAGTAATVSLGTVSTGAPGSSVIITEGGTAQARTFSFTIPAGATGTAGRSAGLAYTFDSSTAASAPSTGVLRFNNSAMASVTALYISETDADGNTVAPVLATWDDGTSTIRGKLRVSQPSAPANWAEFNITGTLSDNGTWDSFTLGYLGHGGTFTAGAALAVLFVPKGDKGETGADSTVPGPTGPVVAIKYNFSTTTADADPGSGNVRFNNVVPASVTFLYFDNVDGGGNAQTTWLDSFDDSTNPAHRGTLTIVPVDTPAGVLTYNVTGAVVDGTGYRKVPVAHVSGTTLPANTAALGVAFARTGNKGSDGAGSGDTVAPATATEGNFASFGAAPTDLEDSGYSPASFQGADATLTALAGLATAANKGLYATGVDTFATFDLTSGGRAALGLTYAADKTVYWTAEGTAATTDLTAFGRTLAALADAAAGRAALDLEVGTDVQAFDASLTSIAALGTAADRIAYTTGVDTWAEAPITSFGRSLIDDADASAARTTLGAQQQDALLDALAGLSMVADRYVYGTGTDAVALGTITAAGRALLDDADAAAQRTTLGVDTLLDAKEPLGEVTAINTQTGSYTLVIGDKGKIVEMNVAGANNLTVPPNSSVAFPVKTRIDLVQYGAGQTTVVAGSGVTIRSSGGKLKLTGQYSGASLYKRGTDEWVLVGDIAT